MKTKILETIDQVFLQFEFNLKVMAYFELNKVDKNDFDTDLTILDDKNNIVYPNSSFHTYDDLILAAQNNVSMCFGVTAITLDTALADAGIDRNPDDLSEKGCLRTIIYMVRCAFAHNMMEPKWEVRGNYNKSIELNLNNIRLLIDLPQLNGKVFEYNDIGGTDNWLTIKELTKKIIADS